MESLRKEAKYLYNIDIITIKPGSVKTSMTEDQIRIGSIEVDTAANIIFKGIQKRKKVIEFPFVQVFATKFKNMLPAWAYDCIPFEFVKGDDYYDIIERFNSGKKEDK